MTKSILGTIVACAALIFYAASAQAQEHGTPAAEDAAPAVAAGRDAPTKAGSLADRLRSMAISPAAATPLTVAKPAAVKDGHGSGWAYEGNNGPDHWGGISAGYEACGAGRMQSPIDLTSPSISGSIDIAFDYKPTILQVLNNGHTFQVNYGPGSGITIEGDRFELLQFHFHTPSEHARDGRRYPMEAHLVHKNAAGQLAVIGVMLEVGAENIALMEMWEHMPMQAGAVALIGRVAINAADLVPNGTQYYRYMGSLTTPPCSEGVNWLVADKAISVNAAQVNKFQKAVHGSNARPIQALNNRLLGGPAVN